MAQFTPRTAMATTDRTAIAKPTTTSWSATSRGSHTDVPAMARPSNRVTTRAIIHAPPGGVWNVEWRAASFQRRSVSVGARRGLPGPILAEEEEDQWHGDGRDHRQVLDDPHVGEHRRLLLDRLVDRPVRAAQRVGRTRGAEDLLQIVQAVPEERVRGGQSIHELV